jgi:hypothetical protein
MRPATFLLIALCAAPAWAKLPAPSDQAKAAAAETAAKAAWSDKVGAYQLCKVQDRIAETYRKSKTDAVKDVKDAKDAKDAKSANDAKDAPAPTATPPCTDPGPYVALTPAASKPLEASGAHSPPGMAVGPPSSNATAKQLDPKK